MWYPDRSKATDKDPPLYLHIAAGSPEVLQKAVDKVNELIAIDLGSLVEDKKDRLREKVRFTLLGCNMMLTTPSANGPKRSSLSASKVSAISTCARKWWARACVFPHASIARRVFMLNDRAHL